MKDYLSKKTKNYCSFADGIMTEYRSLKYGIGSCCDDISLDLLTMRYELTKWQEDLDYGALSERVVFNYSTWKPFSVEYEDMHHTTHCEVEPRTPNQASMVYTYGGTHQNVIEVNAGGCLTRINVNPEIIIDNSIHNTTGIVGAYTYKQDLPGSPLWHITHSLGYPPNVITTDLTGNEIAGVVTHIDNNTLDISFSATVTGYAYLS